MNRKMFLTKKTLICFGLCCSLIMFSLTTVSAQTAPDSSNTRASQINSKIQEYKNRVRKIGQGNDITIVTIDGREFYGSVVSIEDDLVLIDEVDQKKLVEIKYQDIKKIRKSYGINRDLNGRRIRPRKNAIGILIATAAILIPVIILASAKD